MDVAFRRAVAEARKHGDLYFASLLSEDRILELFGSTRWFWQGWIYTPAVTIWVFLSQCLSADHSCRDAVAGLIAWRLARGLRRCSAKTGAYCTAREDLPEEACSGLMRETGRECDEEVPPEWRWLGHRVLDVDGSTVTMPDTPENQAEYPQVPGQKPGCGFPIARIVVVFSLAVGTVLNAAIGKYKGNRPARTACSARYMTCSRKEMSCSPTAVSAAGLTWRSSTAEARTWSFANTKCVRPTFARDSTWGRMIILCAGRSPHDRDG